MVSKIVDEDEQGKCFFVEGGYHFLVLLQCFGECNHSTWVALPGFLPIFPPTVLDSLYSSRSMAHCICRRISWLKFLLKKIYLRCFLLICPVTLDTAQITFNGFSCCLACHDKAWFSGRAHAAHFLTWFSDGSSPAQSTWVVLPELPGQEVKVDRCLILLPKRRTWLLLVYFCTACKQIQVSSRVQAAAYLLTTVLDLSCLSAVAPDSASTSVTASFDYFWYFYVVLKWSLPMLLGEVSCWCRKKGEKRVSNSFFYRYYTWIDCGCECMWEF